MDQTASRLHPLYSSQMVLRTTQALTANMTQDMGLVKKVLKSSRERDSAQAEVGFCERAEDHGEQHAAAGGTPP